MLDSLFNKATDCRPVTLPVTLQFSKGSRSQIKRGRAFKSSKNIRKSYFWIKHVAFVHSSSNDSFKSSSNESFKWFRGNSLKINVDKCNFLATSNTKTTPKINIR